MTHGDETTEVIAQIELTSLTYTARAKVPTSWRYDLHQPFTIWLTFELDDKRLNFDLPWKFVALGMAEICNFNLIIMSPSQSHQDKVELLLPVRGSTELFQIDRDELNDFLTQGYILKAKNPRPTSV